MWPLTLLPDPSLWFSVVPFRFIPPGLPNTGIPLPTKSKRLGAEENHQGLLWEEPVPLNGDGRAAKERCSPGAELCQGLSRTALRRNCERSRGVGRKDGACCPAFLSCSSRQVRAGFTSSVPEAEGRCPCVGAAINLSSALV